jgi:membrane associated rhomboid family serine protease
MGEADRYGDYRHQRNRMVWGQDNNALMGLFILNVIFFLLLFFIKVIYDYFQHDANLYDTQLLSYFQFPAKLTTLSERPWTILSYMFSHSSDHIWEMISNMLWLWAFGFIMQELTGNKKIIPLYIYGGLFGALFFTIASYAVPSLRASVDTSSLMGANAATMAIAIGVTTLAPNYRIFRNIGNGIPIWVLTLCYVLIDLVSAFALSSGYSIAHLGGAFAGFLFVYTLRRGYDGSIWMNELYNWFMNLFNPEKKTVSPSVKEKVFYNMGGRQPYKKNVNITQQRVDEILDKINQQGYHLLTDEEKNILKRAAEEDL